MNPDFQARQMALEYYRQCYDMAPNTTADWQEVRAFSDFILRGTLPPVEAAE